MRAMAGLMIAAAAGGALLFRSRPARAHQNSGAPVDYQPRKPDTGSGWVEGLLAVISDRPAPSYKPSEAVTMTKQFNAPNYNAEAVPHPEYGPRGIRNNNPGNIEHRDNWRGLDFPPDDGRYCRFVHPKWGYRAMARIIRNYAGRGVGRLNQVIETWAPAQENDTAAYVSSVAGRMGLAENAVINAADAEQLADLLDAMTWHENGEQPYPRFVILDGVALE